VVTGAGVLLIVGGVLGILLGILLLAGAGAVRGRGAGGLFTVVGFISIVVGTVQSYAGVQVLNLREIGRTLGIAIAAVAPSSPCCPLGERPARSSRSSSTCSSSTP
jgi:hypothetical protein